MDVQFEDWRTGDQFYYVSNTNKFKEATGWEPKVSVDEGVEQLLTWLCKNRNIELPQNLNSTKEIAI